MKKIKYLVAVLLLVLVVGCGKKATTYEFTSENTKEKIKVTISEYTLVEKEQVIRVMNGETEEAKIIFITKTNYDELKTLLDNKTIIPIESGKKDSSDYLYKVSEEYDYVAMIKDSESGVAISSKSEETIRKIIDVISFSK